MRLDLQRLLLRFAARAGAMALLTACTGPTGPAIPSATEPGNAVFVTADVDRFWRAYRAGGRAGIVQSMQTLYLDSASAGLREFSGKRAVTALALTTMSASHPRYFDSVRDWWSSGAAPTSVFDRIRLNYARTKQLYPRAVFPPVTFLVGRFTTGGTLGREGLFIGLEFFGRDAGAPTSELGAFARANVLSWQEDLPHLVAHEHAHTMQLAEGARLGSSLTLLQQSLSEGGAEFVAELTSGRAHFGARFVEWQARESEFWTAFAPVRGGTDASRWLRNQGNGSGDWPGDLGYFIGYRIAQAYYLRATDKSRALRDLLQMRDAERILTLSGYAGTGPTIIDARARE